MLSQFALALVVLSGPALAAPPPADPATLCETAVTSAEYAARLPPRLLAAISVTETGRPDGNGHIRPWPWTINAEGEGRYFDSAKDAIAAVRALQAKGVKSIDVGCMQVNLMYHPDAFASLEDAFDPRTNAGYAAKFLNALYAQSHDWPKAVAAYHSETPSLGDAYRVLVLARWQKGSTQPQPVARSPYGDFSRSAYGAFAPKAQVYGAFAPR
jgi:hypothetical protein